MFRKLSCISGFSLALITMGTPGDIGRAQAEPAAIQATSQPSSEPMRFEDPGPEAAEAIRSFVSDHVANATEDGRFSIPPGNNLTARIGDFHTVHRRTEATYYVCVDFHDGYNLYDVDFVMEHVPDTSQDDGTDPVMNFVMTEVILHKLNGESLRD